MAVAMLVATVVLEAGLGKAKLAPLVVPLEPFPADTEMLLESLVVTVRAPAHLPLSVRLLLPLLQDAEAVPLAAVRL
jgi:hypothetical protein